MNSANPASPRLLDRVRNTLRVRHYSLRTETAYLDWIKRFILFHGKRDPRDMGHAEVTAFLTDLAVSRNVAASTQNQALAAVLFLYREVLEQDLPWLKDVVRARRPARLPTVLTWVEVARLIDRVDGPMQLMIRLLYGTGMRLMELVRLRVKDVEFERLEITIRDGKGAKDRVTMPPESLAEMTAFKFFPGRAITHSDSRLAIAATSDCGPKLQCRPRLRHSE